MYIFFIVSLLSEDSETVKGWGGGGFILLCKSTWTQTGCLKLLSPSAPASPGCSWTAGCPSRLFPSCSGQNSPPGEKLLLSVCTPQPSCSLLLLPPLLGFPSSRHLTPFFAFFHGFPLFFSVASSSPASSGIPEDWREAYVEKSLPPHLGNRNPVLSGLHKKPGSQHGGEVLPS